MRTDGATELSGILFGKTRRSMLSLFFTHPDQWFHLRQAARFAGAAPGAADRELRKLVAAGIIERAVRGNQVAFHVNPQSPIFPELRSIVVKTMGLADPLRAALAPIADQIELAFIHGSFATGGHRQSSDIDLVIVGDVEFSNCVNLLFPMQGMLGREVNPTVYSHDEFAQKRLVGHNFVNAVVASEKIFLVGDKHDLERLATERVGKASSPKRRRNPPVARSR